MFLHVNTCDNSWLTSNRCFLENWMWILILTSSYLDTEKNLHMGLVMLMVWVTLPLQALGALWLFRKASKLVD